MGDVAKRADAGLPDLDVGDRVQLRVRYTDGWSCGFQIADRVRGGYLIRRVSDGGLLPGPTSPADVRPESSRTWA